MQTEQTRTLETKSLILTFDLSTGSLSGLFSKISNWNIIKRPHLALSWRMMLPLEGRRNNEAWGHLQSTSPHCEWNDTSVQFTWDKIESQYGGVHSITVTTLCEIIDDQAVFRMTIKNRDSVFVENVYYPYIGDLHRTNNCRKLSFEHGSYCAMKKYELYPSFPNQAGTHSVDFPTLCVEDHINPPMNPFGLISDQEGNGLYIGVAQRRIEAVSWHGEYLPGWSNSNDFRVFETDQIDGKDTYTRFAVGHLPFVAPDSEFELLPFSMEAYRGNWNTGADCYTRISTKWNQLPVLPAWAKEPHSWLQIQINSPEDELRLKFKDFPKVGEECKKYGVKAIQLVGWNDGGQDRGNPSHSPDPRLGTFEELKEAIAKIQAMGVKVILFAKFVWADQSLDHFKEEFEKLAVKDPYGNYYVYKGYQYMTLSQMTNVNTRRLIPMCFGSDEYLELCNREFLKCVELGADGILFDECLHHSPTLCCFDTSHGHRYGASTYSWDEKLIDGFRELVKGKEFMIAGEAVYDFQHNYYDLSYTRTWGRDHKAVNRYLRPAGAIMSAVIGFEDRGMMNQCLMNRYIISYEPYNFKGMLSDYPQTVCYGQKMDQLRSDLRDYFWDGTFQDKQGGSVLLQQGEKLSSYSVFRAADGRLGMIIVNYDEENAIMVYPSLNSGKRLSQYRLVEDEKLSSFESGFLIPPKSAAAVI